MRYFAAPCREAIFFLPIDLFLSAFAFFMLFVALRLRHFLAFDITAFAAAAMF